MTNRAWIADLKPGDDVIVAAGWSYKDFSAAKVAKVTRTQIVVGNGRFERRFEKATGIVRGASNYHRSEIQQATPERLAEVRRKEAIDYIAKNAERLHKVDPSVVSTESLEAIVNAIKGA